MNILTRKTTALLAAAAIALPGAAFATAALSSAQSAAQTAPAPSAGQTAPAAPHRHGGFRKMLSQLNLSDQQKQQVQSIIASTKQKNENADPQTRHANMKAAMAQINGILTPDQQTQLKSLRQAARAQHGQGAAQPQPAPTT